MRKAQVIKQQNQTEFEILLSALRDYAEAARQLGEASYLRTLEEALTMTLNAIRNLPGADRLHLPAPAKDALREHLENWLMLHENRYNYFDGDKLAAETRYVRCDAILGVFHAVLSARDLRHIESKALWCLRHRYSTLSPAAFHLFEIRGSTMPRASVLALIELNDRERERESAPQIKRLREQIEALA